MVAIEPSEELPPAERNQAWDREVPEGYRHGHDEIQRALSYGSLETAPTSFLDTQAQTSLHLRRAQRDLAAIQERDRAELRELLQQIIQNTDDVKDLLGHSPEGVDQMMGALQQVSPFAHHPL